MDRIIGWMAGWLITAGKGLKLRRFVRLFEDVLSSDATIFGIDVLLI